MGRFTVSTWKTGLFFSCACLIGIFSHFLPVGSILCAVQPIPSVDNQP
jgi:hypothetical protein